jgi:hypothetical protein
VFLPFAGGDPVSPNREAVRAATQCGLPALALSPQPTFLHETVEMGCAPNMCSIEWSAW